MFKVFPIFILLVISLGSVYSSYSFDGTIKNEKGQTVYNLRDSQHKVEILDKRGFVQGWVDKKTGRTFDKRGFPTGSITPPPSTGAPASSSSPKKR
jgi:hypothetical protein